MRKLTEEEIIRLGSQLERRQWYRAVMKAAKELWEGNFDMVLLVMDWGNSDVESMKIQFEDTVLVSCDDYEWLDEHNVYFMPSCEWDGGREMEYWPNCEPAVAWEEVYVRDDNQLFEEIIPFSDNPVLPDDPLESFFAGTSG